eukprot:scaffold1906_cov106-Isochrysis_galbana.AAC.20
MSAGITKDAIFARWFGAGDSATRLMPRATFGLFAVRDTLTIAAAFTVPSMVAAAIVRSGRMEEARAAEAAQLISPMGMQLICTPIHLMALEAFNKPDASLADRARSAAGIFPQSTLARMGRFCAAYGIGGLLNSALLRHGRHAVKEKFVAQTDPQAPPAADERQAPPAAAVGMPGRGHVIVTAVQRGQAKPGAGAPPPAGGAEAHSAGLEGEAVPGLLTATAGEAVLQAAAGGAADSAGGGHARKSVLSIHPALDGCSSADGLAAPSAAA